MNVASSCPCRETNTQPLSTLDSFSPYKDLTLSISFKEAQVCDKAEPVCENIDLAPLTQAYLTMLKGLVATVFSVVNLAIIFNVSMILRERNIIVLRTHIGVLVLLSISAAVLSLASVIVWFALLEPQINDDISKKLKETFVLGKNYYPIGIASMVTCLLVGSIIGAWTSFLLHKGIGGHWNMAAWFGYTAVQEDKGAGASENSKLLP